MSQRVVLQELLQSKSKARFLKKMAQLCACNKTVLTVKTDIYKIQYQIFCSVFCSTLSIGYTFITYYWTSVFQCRGIYSSYVLLSN